MRIIKQEKPQQSSILITFRSNQLSSVIAYCNPRDEGARKSKSDIIKNFDKDTDNTEWSSYFKKELSAMYNMQNIFSPSFKKREEMTNDYIDFLQKKKPPNLFFYSGTSDINRDLEKIDQDFFISKNIKKRLNLFDAQLSNAYVLTAMLVMRFSKEFIWYSPFLNKNSLITAFVTTKFFHKITYFFYTPTSLYRLTSGNTCQKQRGE
jgi:hypothetical protein